MTAPVGVPTRSDLVRDDIEPSVVEVVTHPPAAGPGPPVGVILAHGAGSDLDAPVLVAAATAVAAAGYLAVRANLGYRQRRATGPPPRAEASVDDLVATWQALARRHPGHRWVLGGASYGGRVATLVAAGRPARPDLAGVLCWSYPLHPPQRPDRLRVAHLADLDVPVLVVQGTNDPFGGPDDLRPHLARAGHSAAVLAVDGADHGLHVPRTRSGDGATHRVDEVVATTAPTVVAWLDGLAPA